MKRAYKNKEEVPEDIPTDNEDDESDFVGVKEKEADEDELETENDVDNDPAAALASREDNPFMDSFYGISSESATERAHAAYVLMQHCLLGQDANHKDASYALKRLLNGLCSGRAAARQGNAATLASFLKAILVRGALAGIRAVTSDDSSDLSDLEYIRRRLLEATEPKMSHGRKKGSEERDYKFGRLFGINSIVRSGILLPTPGGLGDNVVKDVTSGFVADLADLYHYKKWMREPAAHALCVLLSLLYASSPQNTESQNIVDYVVEAVVVPRLLTEGDNKIENEQSSLFATFSAEQIGIAVYIQSNADFHSKDLPCPINVPILTKETIPLLASALSETSTVTQPRTHLFWDTLWTFISETEKMSNTMLRDDRRVRINCPFGKEGVDEMLGAIMQHVVMERFLGINYLEADDSSKNSGKATHERRALALCIVRNLSGVEFVSSLSGRTTLSLNPDMLENLLFNTTIVRRVFLDIICAGKQKGQAAHILKPLALNVLDLVSATLTVSSDEEFLNRRLAVARAFLRTEPRFDSRTKTTFVETLLELRVDFPTEVIPFELWTQYTSFLEHRIVSRDQLSNDDDSNKSHFSSIGYIDLLFHLGKRITRLSAENGSDLAIFKENMASRLLGFLMAIAFYDCSNVVVKVSKGKKPRTGKGTCTISQSAQLIRDSGKGTESIIPYGVRSVASARFFSLVSDVVSSKAHSTRTDKEADILDFITSLHKIQGNLEGLGAKQLAMSVLDDHMEVEEEEKPDSVVEQLLDAAQKCDDMSVQKRWSTACALLASLLHLHLLGCGKPENLLEIDDPDADDKEDVEEIMSTMADVLHVSNLFSEVKPTDEKSLAVLAELCVNILSSHLGIGNQSRGASPTLFREVIKIVWISGLGLSAATIQSANPLNSDVVDTLLNAIGVVGSKDLRDEEDNEDEMDENDDEMDEDNNSDSSQSSYDQGVFAQAKDVSEVRDVKDNEDVKVDSLVKPTEKDDESELEIDSGNLQSMLEDDEIDEGELEHHAGADAALAKLIQLKQDARKASKLARERVEIARQLRCVVLVELLVVGKSETWGSLLRVDLILQMVIPILEYRRELVKHITKANKKGSLAGSGEIRTLIERLTMLLKVKILKAKVPDLLWSDAVDVPSYSTTFSTKLLSLADDDVDQEHQSLCNSSFLYLFRAISDTRLKLEQATLYGRAVAEWSTKRTTRFQSSFFESLIHQNAVLAQACFCDELASAASIARSSFLKSESFRLLSMLYNTKLNANETDFEKVTLERMTEACEKILMSVEKSLKDIEMRKSKRVREILKTTEKVISFVSALPRKYRPQSKCWLTIREQLMALKKDTESKAIESACEKLTAEIDQMKQVELLSTAKANECVSVDQTVSLSVSTHKKKIPKKKQKKQHK